ncbi:hypothetical protein [Desulfonauticus submarinus]
MYKIHYTCPQCGAPFDFKENDKIIFCPYCKVKSIITGEKHLRYVILPKHNLPPNTFFLPYFRIKGSFFFTTKNTVKSIIIDSSIKGINLQEFPLSLGLRPQAMHLNLAYSQKFSFMKPSYDFKTGLKAIENKIAKIKLQGIILKFKDFIGETTSFIYTPVYKKNNYYYDAILNRHICKINEHPLQEEDISSWSINFLPALCPSCGDYLQGEGEDLLLYCKNCCSFYYISPNGLEKIKPGIIKLFKSDLLFPFWEFKIEVPKFNISFFNDMLKFCASLKKAPPKTKAHLLIPGFKIRPDIFLNLSLRLSLHPDFATYHTEINQPTPQTVRLNMPRREAVSAIRLILGYMFKGQEEMLTKLSQFKCKIKEANLIYIPFTRDHLQFIQPQINFGINKNLIRFFN